MNEATCVIGVAETLRHVGQLWVRPYWYEESGSEDRAMTPYAQYVCLALPGYRNYLLLADVFQVMETRKLVYKPVMQKDVPAVQLAGDRFVIISDEGQPAPKPTITRSIG